MYFSVQLFCYLEVPLEILEEQNGTSIGSGWEPLTVNFNGPGGGCLLLVPVVVVGPGGQPRPCFGPGVMVACLFVGLWREFWLTCEGSFRPLGAGGEYCRTLLTG